MNTLEHIKNKYSLDLKQKTPIVLPIDRFEGFCGLLGALGFKMGAEIGVLKGFYSKWMLVKMRRNKPKLFLVDPYESYEEYSEYPDQKEMNDIEAIAKQRLAKFNVEFVKKFSMDAVDDFMDNSLDFVFIDGNHDYKYVLDDISEWSKKVKPGGIVSGHDYSLRFDGVRKAVDEWVETNKIKPWFITKSNNNWFYVK